MAVAMLATTAALAPATTPSVDPSKQIIYQAFYSLQNQK